MSIGPRSWRRPATALACILAMPVAACSADSGARDQSDDGKPIDYAALRNFSGVELTGPDDVVVTVGGPFKVAAEGDPKSIAKLDIRIVNGQLEIGRKRGSHSWFGVNEDGKGVIVRVSMPAIASAELTGSGNLSIDRARGQKLSLDLTGSGDIKLGTVAVADLSAHITGSGNIALAGTADLVDFSTTGSGDLDGQALKAGGGKVSLLGSGDVAFASDGAVDISIMGSGDVTVKGGVKCESSVMGSGEAHCGG